MSIWRFQWDVSGIGSGGPGLMTFHHEYPGEPLDADLGGAVNEQGLFIDAWIASCANGVTYTPPTEVAQVDVPIPVFRPMTVGEPARTGIGGVDALPWHTQLVCGWFSAQRTRSGQGRTFVAGFAEGTNEAGVPNASVVSALQAAGQSLIDRSNTAASPLVVYSRKLNLAYPAVTARVKQRWAYLSSRRD